MGSSNRDSHPTKNNQLLLAECFVHICQEGQVITEPIVQERDAEGFSLLGIAPAISPTGDPQLLQWIEDGFAAEMSYFAERKEAYRHPNAVLDGVRSIVALAFPYPALANREASAPMMGKVARYAMMICISMPGRAAPAGPLMARSPIMCSLPRSDQR